jgi:hypothetical protein
MPRSSYIYTVQRHANPPVLAAFTVKYELVNWMADRPDMRGCVTITRHRDGDTEGYISGVVISPDIEREAYDEDQA